MGLLTAPPGADAEDADGTVYIWPENESAWQAFHQLHTQWRTGMAGATGLDYAGVRAHLELSGIGQRRMRALWPGIQAMERAVLGVWEEERERQRQQRENARRD